jgi:shikimate dehydrogenase
MIHGYWIRQLGIDGSYELMDLAPEQFGDFVTHLAERGFAGGNVTVPHKEAAFAHATRHDEAAQAIGAVNMLWLEDGALVGGNSDAHGFIANLDAQAPGWCVPGCRAVILGAGGAARAATYALLQRGVEVHLVNRTLARAEEIARHFGSRVQAHAASERNSLLAQADVLVNCTSTGMIGKPAMEIDLAPLKPGTVVYDIVYVPLETPLLAQARKQGLRTVDGLGMLLQQAGLGFQKWFGVMPQVTPELRAMVEADVVATTPKA